jgi:aldehyde:ferredoxin oxidoreductase
MSMGVTLAWATEAFQRADLHQKRQAGWPWSGAVTRLISRQPGGSSASPTTSTGRWQGAIMLPPFMEGRLCPDLGGNEMPGYHTGPGCHLGYLTGARHSHLDSAGYSLDRSRH